MLRPAVAEPRRIVKVERARVLEALQGDEPRPVSDARLRHPGDHAVPASVGLDDDLDYREAVEMGRVAVLPPRVRPGDSQSRKAQGPERLRIAFPLDESH